MNTSLYLVVSPDYVTKYRLCQPEQFRNINLNFNLCTGGIIALGFSLFSKLWKRRYLVSAHPQRLCSELYGVDCGLKLRVRFGNLVRYDLKEYGLFGRAFLASLREFV